MIAIPAFAAEWLEVESMYFGKLYLDKNSIVSAGNDIEYSAKFIDLKGREEFRSVKTGCGLTLPFAATIDGEPRIINSDDPYHYKVRNMACSIVNQGWVNPVPAVHIDWSSYMKESEKKG